MTKWQRLNASTAIEISIQRRKSEYKRATDIAATITTMHKGHNRYNKRFKPFKFRFMLLNVDFKDFLLTAHAIKSKSQIDLHY